LRITGITNQNKIAIVFEFKDRLFGYCAIPGPYEFCGNTTAAALDIETHLLFEVSTTPEEALEWLHRSVITDIKQVVREAIKETLAEEYKAKSKD
jgi:hypothetical protein